MTEFDIALVRDFICAAEQYNRSPFDVKIAENYNEIKCRIERYISNLGSSVLGSLLIEDDKSGDKRMQDPKLKLSRVFISYSATNGYRKESTYSSAQMNVAKELKPVQPLLSALEELARLTALFGYADEALEVFNGARERVAHDKAKRAKP